MHHNFLAFLSFLRWMNVWNTRKKIELRNRKKNSFYQERAYGVETATEEGKEIRLLLMKQIKYDRRLLVDMTERQWRYVRESN